MVFDGVTLRPPANETERDWLQDVLDGWTTPAPATVEEFRAHAQAAGFEVLRQQDTTVHVLASARRIAAIAARVLRPLLALSLIPLLSRSVVPLGFASPRHARRFVAACRSQARVLDARLAAYYVQVFRRPAA